MHRARRSIWKSDVVLMVKKMLCDNIIVQFVPIFHSTSNAESFRAFGNGKNIGWSADNRSHIILLLFVESKRQYCCITM